MGKKPGILKKLIRRKDDKPIKNRQAYFSGAEKETVNKTSFIDSDYNDVQSLEETPIRDAGTARRRIEYRSAREKNAFFSEPVKLSGTAETKKRFHGKKSFLRTAADKTLSLFAKDKQTKSNNSAALEFAESRRRYGKKGRRNRRIVLYAGTGLVVVVALLVIFFVPSGEAAPAGPDPTASAQQSRPLAQADAVALIQGPRALQPEAEPEETPTPIPTTQHDVSLENVAVALPETSEQSEEPTETTEPSPIPTTKPDPTPVPVAIDDLVEDFVVEADLYYNKAGYSSNHYDYTDEEKYMLAQIISYEAGGEPTEGKLAVGNVVMNRVFYGYWGHSIKSVLSAKGQFSNFSFSNKPSSAAKAAASAILDFEVWVVPQNTYYFKATRLGKRGASWGGHEYYKTIGGHHFYTEHYGGRSNSDAVPPALFKRTFKYPQYGCKPESRVYRVQCMLHKLGYKVDADKYFGMSSKEALFEFQNDKGLEADGVAGPTTLKTLIKAYGIKDYYSDFYE